MNGFLTIAIHVNLISSSSALPAFTHFASSDFKDHLPNTSSSPPGLCIRAARGTRLISTCALPVSAGSLSYRPQCCSLPVDFVYLDSSIYPALYNASPPVRM